MKFRIIFTIALLIVLAGCWVIYSYNSQSSAPASDPNAIRLN